MGLRLTKLEPVHGFAAETAAGLTIQGAALLGIPLSTTHTIATAIMGVGASRRLSAVRWGVAGKDRAGLDPDLPDLRADRLRDGPAGQAGGHGGPPLRLLNDS